MKSIPENQFKFFGCKIITDIGNNECTSNNCSSCEIAQNYIVKENTKKNIENIPHLHRITNGVHFLLNSTDTIARLNNVDEAKKFGNNEYSYSEVGYSLSIIKRYPLFARLKKTIGLPIPRKILWSNKTRPILVVYENCVYVISPVIKYL